MLILVEYESTGGEYETTAKGIFFLLYSFQKCIEVISQCPDQPPRRLRGRFSTGFGGLKSGYRRKMIGIA
jgi:hypothetical protein